MGGEGSKTDGRKEVGVDKRRRRGRGWNKRSWDREREKGKRDRKKE